MTRDQRSYDVSVRISKELAVPTGAPQPVVAPVMQVEEGYPFSIFDAHLLRPLRDARGCSISL